MRKARSFSCTRVCSLVCGVVAGFGRTLLPIATLGFVLLVVPTVDAQQQPVKIQKHWRNEAEASFVMTSGNTETKTLAFSDTFTYNWQFSELTLYLAGLRAETTTQVLEIFNGAVQQMEQKAVSAEAYQFRGQFRYNWIGDMFWYVSAGWQRNRFSGFENRYMGGGGAGYRFLENEIVVFVGEIGGSLTSEDRTDGSAESHLDARSFFDYRYNFSDHARFTSTLEVLVNVEDLDDLRINSVTALTAALTAKLALRAGYTINYDRQPVSILVQTQGGVGVFTFSPADTTLSTSLVFTF